MRSQLGAQLNSPSSARKGGKLCSRPAWGCVLPAWSARPSFKNWSAAYILCISIVEEIHSFVQKHAVDAEFLVRLRAAETCRFSLTPLGRWVGIRSKLHPSGAPYLNLPQYPQTIIWITHTQDWYIKGPINTCESHKQTFQNTSVLSPDTSFHLIEPELPNGTLRIN